MRRAVHDSRDLRSIDELARALAEAVASDRVIHVVLAHTVGLMGADLAWLVSADDGSAWIGDGERNWTPTADDSDRMLMYRTADGEVHAEDIGAGGVRGMSSIVAVRPAGDGGFLLVAGRRDPKPFSANERDRFGRIALHAGIALENLRLVTRLRSELVANAHLANHDSLTGLPNRARFHAEVCAALGAGDCAAVLLIDLDRFKEVNDTLGHHNGDVVLEEVGRRVTDCLDDGDLVARLGGDEFAVLLRGAHRDDDAVEQVGKAIQREMERPFLVADLLVDVGASIGIAVPAAGGDETADVLRRADVAMYSAKNAHQGVAFYTVGLDHYSPHRLALVPRFRSAIEHGELMLYFQPQVELETGRVMGVETLLRWPLPGKGFIAPDEFIPIAERTDLIGPLTRLLLFEAVEQCARWCAMGWDLRMSVNLSARNLAEPDLANHILTLIDRAGVPRRQLCVEVTETTVMQQRERSVQLLAELRNAGVAVAIDDFGTGHSSLAYLSGLPASELKIDRSFIMALGEDPTAEQIVWAVVNLGLNLGLEVVAEGVETTLAAEMLRRMGCKYGQGYFYGRAMAADVFARWFAERTGASTPEGLGPSPRLYVDGATAGGGR